MFFSCAYYVLFVAITNKNKERVAKMNESKLELYWNDIPTTKNDAVTYALLKMWWGTSEREVRKILHRLSEYDNGDNYVLIRSGKSKGFYKTDDAETIKEYKAECLSKGRSVFAPIKKINRILTANKTQYSMANNLRVIREEKGLTQSYVCEYMKPFDEAFDAPMLSKMENGVCLPTPFQLSKLAVLYDCNMDDLVSVEMFY